MAPQSGSVGQHIVIKLGLSAGCPTSTTPMLARLGDDKAAANAPLLEGLACVAADRFTRTEGAISLLGDFGKIRLSVLRANNKSN